MTPDGKVMVENAKARSDKISSDLISQCEKKGGKQGYTLLLQCYNHLHLFLFLFLLSFISFLLFAFANFRGRSKSLHKGLHDWELCVV